MGLSTARFARDTGHETIPQRMMSHKITAAQSMAPIALPSMIPLAGAESSIAVVVSASSAGSTNRAALSVVAPGRCAEEKDGKSNEKGRHQVAACPFPRCTSRFIVETLSSSVRPGQIDGRGNRHGPEHRSDGNQEREHRFAPGSAPEGHLGAEGDAGRTAMNHFTA